VALIFGLVLIGVIGFVSPSRAVHNVNQWLVFTSARDSVRDLYLIRVDGGSIRRLTYDPQRDSHARWSLDGAWIVFETHRNHNWDIYRIRPNGKGLQALTSTPYIERSPYWNQDGQSIIYRQNYLGNVNLYVQISRDGDFVASSTDLPPYIPDILSPDGRWLAQVRIENNLNQLYVLDLHTNERTRLSDGNHNDLAPAWSPDGGWLAFESDRGGNFDIYRMRRDGSDLRQITTDLADDNSPSWSPQFEGALHWLVLSICGLLSIAASIVLPRRV
jgi:TolB protein